jgi:hypothetical protein
LNDLLRHTLATLAYRGGKAVRGAPASFPGFEASPGTRTPGRILAHINDLLAWALHLAEGRHVWEESAPGAWDDDVVKFHAALELLDAHSKRRLDGAGREQAAAPHHPMVRKRSSGWIAGAIPSPAAPVRGENYFKADIRAGQVGAAQPPSRVEFD